MSNRKLKFKLSPELSDGDHWTVVDDLDAIIDSIKTWYENAVFCNCKGEHFAVKTVMMSDEEVKDLPEI